MNYTGKVSPLHQYTSTSSPPPSLRWVRRIFRSHEPQQIFKDLSNMPVTFSRCFVKRNLPLSWKWLDCSSCNLSFVYKVELRSNNDYRCSLRSSFTVYSMTLWLISLALSPPFILRICFLRLSTSCKLASCVKLVWNIVVAMWVSHGSRWQVVAVAPEYKYETTTGLVMVSIRLVW